MAKDKLKKARGKAKPKATFKKVKPISGKSRVHKFAKRMPKKSIVNAKAMSEAMKKAKFKTAKKVAKKTLARKVVSKLGPAGKVAVGASMLYDMVKASQKGKKGCGPGMRKVTKAGKSYCTPIKGGKKGRDY